MAYINDFPDKVYGQVKVVKRGKYVSGVISSHARSLMNQSGIFSIMMGRVTRNVS